MADDVKEQTPTTDGETTLTPSAPTISQEEYGQLKDYYERTSPFLQKLAPNADLYTELADDEDLRNLYVNTKKSYRALKESEVKPEQAMLEEVRTIGKQVKQWNEAQLAVQRSHEQAALAKANEVISRMKAEHAELNTPEGNDFFMTVANYAGRRGMDYGEAWNEYTSKLGLYREQLPAAKSEPPRSLRSGGVTQPGVPTETKPKVKNQKELGDYLRSSFKRAANR
jgi:hypothetical protein